MNILCLIPILFQGWFIIAGFTIGPLTGEMAEFLRIVDILKANSNI